LLEDSAFDILAVFVVLHSPGANHSAASPAAYLDDPLAAKELQSL
jgi:hypothetical protein